MSPAPPSRIPRPAGGRPPRAGPPRRPWRSFLRAVSWHRRALAAVAAGLAVLSAVSAALPPEPPTVAVVVARSQLRGGVALTADDLEVRRMTVDDAPQGFLGEVATLTGRTLAAPVAQG